MELSEEEKLPRIEMHAIDVKTTIFSCEVNLIKLGFHKVLELSNTRNELVILSIIKFLLVGSFCISPSGYLDYLYSFFFLVLMCNHFFIFLTLIPSLKISSLCFMQLS